MQKHIDQLQCRHQLMFMVSWVSIVIWLIISYANVYGKWLNPDVLDKIGITLFPIFFVVVFFSFSHYVLSFYKVMRAVLLNNKAYKILFFLFIISFGFFLLILIWKIGSLEVNSIKPNHIFYVTIKSLLCSLLAATIVCIVFSVLFLFLFVLTGRIRRLITELLLIVVLECFLCFFASDILYTLVVVISLAFMYDIICFADFKIGNK